MALTKVSGEIIQDSITIGGGTTIHSGGLQVGLTDLHPTGLEIHNINATGVITATSFVGDISQATGAAAGLGTALSDDQTNPLNKVYYTDTILSIGSTITVNPPDSSNIAYTQYAEIVVEDGYDLIIEDGDDLIPDILGLSTGTAAPLSGAGGRIRADQFTNKAGTGAPTFTSGLNVNGNVSIAGTITYEDVTNVDAVGLVTARSGILVSSGSSIGIGTNNASMNLHLYNDDGSDNLLLQVNGDAAGSTKQNAIRFYTNDVIQGHIGVAVDDGRLNNNSVGGDFIIKSWGNILLNASGSGNETLGVTTTGITRQRDYSGNYHVIASSRDGSTSARAATSAWEIKKTLGPDAKTGYYYLTNPYDNTTQQWWCDMETDGGGWILVAFTGDGTMGSSPGNWYDRNNKGGFNGLTQGYFRGGGYWNTWGDLKGQLMWEVRTLDTYFNNSSCSKVGINWGKTNNLPTAGTTGYGNITGNGNTLFENWCWDIYNAPGFDPSNYSQPARNNRIGGNNNFTEHMVITWTFRDTSGSADDGSSGPYWMIGSHHDGLHQHYEESLSGGDGVNGDGGYQVTSNEDTTWGGGGQQYSMNRLARINDNGSVRIWMR